MKHLAATREENYAQTLAWADKGFRLLPTKNYSKYTDFVRAAQHTTDSLLDTFCSDYPRLVQNARTHLNGSWREEDFPSNIRERFSMSLDFAPVPTGGDFRIELSQEEIAAIAGNTEERIKAAFVDAQNDAVKRLYDVVAKIHERLSQPEAIFRDSLIENAKEVCDVLKRINLTDDKVLEKLRRETELLAGTTVPETLRGNPDVRLETANRAQNILDAFTQTYGKGIFA